MKSLDLPSQLVTIEHKSFERKDKKVSPDFKSMLYGDFITDNTVLANDRNLKAVKSDNAEVPVGVWNNQIVGGVSSEIQDNALEVFRNKFVIRWFRRRVLSCSLVI